jgi:CheY-like chemotaxis protein
MPDRINILLVDDDPDDHFLFENALSDVKALRPRLVSAYNGRQALDYLADSTSPDFIVLDLNMPLVDGYEMLDKLKTSPRWQHIPTFVLTTSNKELDALNCKAKGCLEFYTKPMSGEEFSAIIEDMLSKSSTGF